MKVYYQQGTRDVVFSEWLYICLQTAGSTSGVDELGQTTSDDLETEVIMKVIELELLQGLSRLYMVFDV